MAFIDELTFSIKAGRGGDGVVRWRHEKGKEWMGPGGGNGGKGGDVYIRAIRDIAILARYKNQKEWAAGDADAGFRNGMAGKAGEDLFIDLPIGSVVTNLATRKRYDLTREGEEILILQGGKGGFGNEHFKGSTNVSPEESTPGKMGETGDFKVELELIVDAGFIGFPNAGKSSLLNALTNAQSKVGAYKFTTLEPTLGDMHGYILADIPGLIEGASEGKGLGHKFLRHVKRTKMLFHCISLEETDPLAAYDAIREELGKFSPELIEKPEVIILTKTDVVSEEELAEKKALIKKRNPRILSVTVLDDASIKAFGDALIKELRTQEEKE